VAARGDESRGLKTRSQTRGAPVVASPMDRCGGPLPLGGDVLVASSFAGRCRGSGLPLLVLARARVLCADVTQARLAHRFRGTAGAAPGAGRHGGGSTHFGSMRHVLYGTPSRRGHCGARRCPNATGRLFNERFAGAWPPRRSPMKPARRRESLPSTHDQPSLNAGAWASSSRRVFRPFAARRA
jgi:hypothetical protein